MGVTVKQLKSLIKDLPDDTPVVSLDDDCYKFWDVEHIKTETLSKDINVNKSRSWDHPTHPSQKSKLTLVIG
jgi:uncharacterized protein YdeI (YjbR/CyaY-like superfamily)